MADTSDDAIWSTLGAQPAAPATSAPPAATNDDAIWSTLGSKDATTTTPDTFGADPNRIHFDPDRLRIIGNALVRGVHQGLDVPAEALAGGADWVARQFGYNTNQQAQTKAGDVAFNQPYDVNPENQGIGPGAARLGGNLLVTLPAAIGAGGLATKVAGIGTDLLSSAAGAAEPYVASALRYVPGLAGGAASGATAAAQTGQNVGEGTALGGGVGAAAPFLADTGNALLASRNPAVVKAVTEHGIPLRTGQVADSRIIRYLDDITAPESSNVAQRTAVTTDAARSMGVTPEVAAANDLPAGQITPKTMAFARKLNGGTMNDVESATTIDHAPALGLVTDLRNIAQDAAKTPSAFDDVKTHIKDIVDSISANGGTLPGKTFGDLIAHGTPLDVATNSSNSVVKEYAGRIKEALQDAMQASATPENATLYAQARLQYKNMMTLAGLVNKGIPGQISPLLLQGAANRSFTGNAFRGAGQLGDLGDVAQQYLKAPPQSGTEPRQLVRATLYGRLEELGKFMASVAARPVVQSVLGRNPLQPFGTGSPGAVNTAVPSALILRNQLQQPPPP